MRKRSSDVSDDRQLTGVLFTDLHLPWALLVRIPLRWGGAVYLRANSTTNPLTGFADALPPALILALTNNALPCCDVTFTGRITRVYVGLFDALADLIDSFRVPTLTPPPPLVVHVLVELHVEEVHSVTAAPRWKQLLSVM